jgi:hypothetical protein
MSQEFKTATKRSHRTRTARNRPVLVTENMTDSTAPEATATGEQGLSQPTTGHLALEEAGARTTGDLANPAPARRLSRLPNFFKKTEQETTTSEQDIVNARMARAKKNASDNNDKAAATAIETSSEARAQPAKAQPAKAQPAKRPSMFKPRHIIGLVIYMLVANFVLTFEHSYAISAHIERTLFTIPGFNLPISTSILLNIVTLIVVLYLMVTFDLLPSGKQYAQQQAGQSRNANRGAQSNATRRVQPVARQGVQGEDDDLYQAYRQNQRNKKH